MSEEKEKDKTGEENSNAAEVIKELGLLTTGSGFKSEIQYINNNRQHRRTYRTSPG